MKRKAKHLGLELIGLVLSLIVLIPFYMLIINSGKTKEEAALVGLSLPTEWNFLKNYAEMFSAGRLGVAFKNSVLLTVPSVLLVILLCAATAFVLQRRRGRASSVLSTSCWACLFPGRLSQPTLFAIICICLHFWLRHWFFVPPTSPWAFSSIWDTTRVSHGRLMSPLCWTAAVVSVCLPP